MINNKTHSKVEISTFQQVKQGNKRCGDDYVTIETESSFICALADGLGSGEGAHCSANIAMEVVKDYYDEDVSLILDKCNQALIHERGVVITILKFYFDTNEIIYGNIGNVETFLFSKEGEMRRPIPVPGYLCGRKFRYRLERFPMCDGSYFVLHSDGMTISRTDQESIKHSECPNTSIQQIAQKAQKKNDDIAVIVGRMT
ncbi:indirect negative regulator of sigma-B activity [Salibacterium salarium]|uniref:Indirect negative regulator of sigma-B activity n=1 Tax=Salibacterium salarium TaxID=284579 RepID=A0A3R9PXX1_9BACI|nr:PP2C family serine/threonine-protein phosphatase [Salibacterium salarium]RSL29415.1 indirect negative regulator of sigma-B activity [Salibacterium salarium]